VLDTIEKDGLLDDVVAVGQQLRAGLAAEPRVTEVRGEGLLIGVDLAAGLDAAAVTTAALEARLHRQQPDPGAVAVRAAAGPHRADVARSWTPWPAILDDAADTEGSK
jgi:acetylornithine/N-succinyldiaminopimelate aminotransferase